MATLNIAFTIDDNKVAAIKDDFAAYKGWTATIKNAAGEDIQNPETQNAFIKRMIGEYIKECVKAHRVNSAMKSSQETAINNANTNIVLS